MYYPAALNCTVFIVLKLVLFYISLHCPNVIYLPRITHCELKHLCIDAKIQIHINEFLIVHMTTDFIYAKILLVLKWKEGILKFMY